MEKFKIFDNKEKAFLTNYDGFDLEFETVEEAEERKTDLLDAGNYLDEPHTVLSVLQYEGNKFVKLIC